MNFKICYEDWKTAACKRHLTFFLPQVRFHNTESVEPLVRHVWCLTNAFMDHIVLICFVFARKVQRKLMKFVFVLERWTKKTKVKRLMDAKKMRLMLTNQNFLRGLNCCWQKKLSAYNKIIKKNSSKKLLLFVGKIVKVDIIISVV